MQEVRNAVDQAQREIATRFDFKDTDSLDRARRPRDQARHVVTRTGCEPCVQVLEEKLVKRQVLAQGPRLRQGRGGLEGHRPPDHHAQGRHLERQGQGDQQVHQGPRPQGRAVADPGRTAAGHGQEARRPPSGDRRAQGRGPRHPAAVPELPGLARLGQRIRPSSSHSRPRSRATRSAVGGWLRNMLANCTLRPLSGLTM